MHCMFVYINYLFVQNIVQSRRIQDELVHLYNIHKEWNEWVNSLPNRYIRVFTPTLCTFLHQKSKCNILQTYYLKLVAMVTFVYILFS